MAAFRADLKAMQDLVADPATDLFTPLPHGEGQTLLREALLVAVTGYGQDEDVRRSRAAGFDHHLVKPADPDALAALFARPAPACESNA